MTKKEFVDKGNIIHNYQYDYSKVEFVKMLDKVIIICKTHGEFIQSPAVHINDRCGCSKCGKIKKSLKRTKSNEKFIHDSKAMFGETKYGYEKCFYIKAKTKVILTCWDHGDFEIEPNAHLSQGQGCKLCGNASKMIPHRKTNEKFKSQAIAKWGNRYDYTLTEYISKNIRIEYTCHIHGLQKQKPTLHLKHGCQYCNGRGISKYTVKDFIEKAISIHGDHCDYSLITELNGINSKVKIICRKKHGVFEQTASQHLNSEYPCPQCAIESSTSVAQREIEDFVRTIYKGEIKSCALKVIGNREIDIYLPEIKFGIEYHGLYYHREENVGKYYHLGKADAADKAGIKLIQIFEHEWTNKQEIVKSIISYNLGISDTIHARKCEIVYYDEDQILKIGDKDDQIPKNLTLEEKNDFLEENHLQGIDNSKCWYGLTYQGELVCIMTWGVPRFNRNFSWELIRFACKKGITVVGGASRLLKASNKKNIISYADRRWSNGKLYEILKFELDGKTNPGYFYYHIKNKDIKSRLTCQKQLLIDEGFDATLTEYEIMQSRGFDRIWDAGQYRFVMESLKPGE